MPSFLILTSGFLPFSIDNEVVHKIILLVAAPISFYALLTGYKNHKAISFLCIGLAGLSLLIAAVILGEDRLGEMGEKLLTLLGSLIVAYAHFSNYRICKKLTCDCHE